MAGYPEREQEPHGAYAPAGMARESVTPPASNNVKTIDLVELMYRLLGSWKLITCLAVGFALIIGAYTSYFVTPMYEATSIIYVLSNRDSAINMSDLQLGSELTQDVYKRQGRKRMACRGSWKSRRMGSWRVFQNCMIRERLDAISLDVERQTSG